MNKLLYVLLFLGFSADIRADIIDKLPTNEAEQIVLIDPKLDEEIKRAENENDNFALTMLYFLGADEDYYAGSLFVEKIAPLEKGEHIKILPTRLAENGPEEEPYDFWYKIALDNKEAWVYGHHIIFTNRIPINK